MRGVMAHPCCTHRAGADEGATGAPAATLSAPDCCQVRSLPQPAASAPTRALPQSAPIALVAVYLPSARLPDPSAGHFAHGDPRMRTGPPGLRALARLQVFRI
jgi:hypothetical protein